eukprot:1149014-Pelagomonas_calceolata.AAC.3
MKSMSSVYTCYYLDGLAAQFDSSCHKKSDDVQNHLVVPVWSELRGGWVIRSVHQCGPLSLIDAGSVSLPT